MSFFGKKKKKRKRGILSTSTDVTPLSTALALVYLKKLSPPKKRYTGLYKQSEAQERGELFMNTLANLYQFSSR